MVKERKINYGFAFDLLYEDMIPFYDYIVFNKNLIDMYFNYEDLDNIKEILKEKNWKSAGKKTYESNGEVEVVYEKEGKKLMFYINKSEVG